MLFLKELDLLQSKTEFKMNVQAGSIVRLYLCDIIRGGVGQWIGFLCGIHCALRVSARF